MKLQIDTTEKVIRVLENVNLGDLTKTLNTLFPKGEWKKFSLETNVNIDYSNPIIVRVPEFIPYKQPWWVPYSEPVYVCTSTPDGLMTVSQTADNKPLLTEGHYNGPNIQTLQLATGTFNVDVQI